MCVFQRAFVLPTDADLMTWNCYLTLSARVLNPLLNGRHSMLPGVTDLYHTLELTRGVHFPKNTTFLFYWKS